MPTALGTNVPVRIKAIVFQSADRLIMVQLTTPQQFGEELMPVMDQVIESVKLSEE